MIRREPFSTLLSPESLAARRLPCVFVTALTVLVFWVDISTPPYVVMLGFYLFPIGLSVWFCPGFMTLFVLGCAVSTSVYMTHLIVPADAPFWEAWLAYFSDLTIFVSFALLMRRLRAMIQKAQRESLHDALTGVMSRRGFESAARLELVRAARFGHALTVAVADLDNFKQVNDTFGHRRGDDLLAAAANCMLSTVRDIDLVARVGGDEFALLFPNTQCEEAEEILRRLRSRLDPLLKAYDPGVSISIGIACSDSAQQRGLVSLDDLIDRADKSMYEQKKGRR